MYLSADLATMANASPSPRVEIRWVDPDLPRVWQIGEVVDGEFHPWAGGTSEEALRKLIAMG